MNSTELWMLSERTAVVEPEVIDFGPSVNDEMKVYWQADVMIDGLRYDLRYYYPRWTSGVAGNFWREQKDYTLPPSSSYARVYEVRKYKKQPA